MFKNTIQFKFLHLFFNFNFESITAFLFREMRHKFIRLYFIFFKLKIEIEKYVTRIIKKQEHDI